MSNLAKVVITLLGFACWLFNAPPVMCLPVFIALVWMIADLVPALVEHLKEARDGK